MAFSNSVKKFFGVDDTIETPAATQPEEKKSDSPMPSDELAHINQEMYKKSAELAEKNKTLSLLQKINELILGSITHPDEIARQVVTLLVTEIDFQVGAVYQYDKEKEVLRLLASARTGQTNENKLDPSEQTEIAMTDGDNIIVKAINEKHVLYTGSLVHIFTESEAANIEIKSVFIAPLHVRNELIGAIIIGMREPEDQLSEYRHYLLVQLAELVGIGIDNAMLYNEVQVTNQQLKDLDKLKDEFVSVASHELRTPMTAIKSYLWMALEGKGGALNDKQHYYVERGYNSVDRLIRLVNDMLNISRIESGRITISFESVDLSKLTQEVVEEVMPRANELGVTLNVENTETLPPVVADSDKIKEVLFNLIGNSLKFTPRDGHITVSFSRKDGFIQTSIKDSGAGIEAEDIGKLFQKFGLLPGSYTTNQPAMGTGLGLYISRSIIELHDGKIWAESEGRGKGATFSFLLKELTDADKSRIHPKSDKLTEDNVGLIHSQI